MSWKRWRIGTERCLFVFDEIPTKQRPRHDPRSGRTYTPAKTAEAERYIGEQWAAQCGTGMAGFGGEVRVFIQASRQLAKSNPKFWAGRADLMKPDADNLAKLVCDALNGIAYKDDSQVTCLMVEFTKRAPHGSGCLVYVSIDYFGEEYVKGDGND